MKLERETTFASPALLWSRTRSRSAWGQTRLALLTALPMAWVLATPTSATAGWGTAPESASAAAGPGAVFATIEAAVFDALAHARDTHAPRDHGRLRAGTIYRAVGGYAYTEPTRSVGQIWSIQSPVVRFRLGSDDVASYVIHPRSGRTRLDRLNEGLNSAERRIVDELDPMGRPLYLITPTHRVVRYFDRVTTEVEVDREAVSLLVVDAEGAGEEPS